MKRVKVTPRIMKLICDQLYFAAKEEEKPDALRRNMDMFMKFIILPRIKRWHRWGPDFKIQVFDWGSNLGFKINKEDARQAFRIHTSILFTDDGLKLLRRKLGRLCRQYKTGGRKNA